MKKTIWGILILAAAVCILLGSLGVNLGLIGELPTFTVVVLAVALAIVVCLAVDREWAIIPFPVAVAFLLVEDEIASLIGREGEDLIGFWAVLGCAVLMSIGLSLVTVPAKARRNEKNAEKSGVGAGSKVFGSDSRYIDCRNFREFSYDVKMADGELYFLHPEEYAGNGVLVVSCKMGNLSIHVPAGWNIQNDIDCSLGAVSMPEAGNPGGPSLRITGECHLGNIDITYC